MIADTKFVALNREIELAKRLTCSGLSALRKATPARPGVYYDAFFGMSIGLERFGKLVWLIDECITRKGAFPSDKDLKKVGHNILDLIKKAEAIRTSRPSRQNVDTTYTALPCDPATVCIIKFLSDFARTARYFNVDFIVGAKADSVGDPIRSWHNVVGTTILAIPEIRSKQPERYALAIAGAHALSPAIVFATAPDGSSITDVSSLLVSEQEAVEINKQAQWKILGIVRFLSLLLIDLGDAANAEGHNFIPYLREHIGFFCEKDATVRRYKTWPPRGIS
jgi:hypothetical protein